MELERVFITTTDSRYDETNPEHWLYRIPTFEFLAIGRIGLCFNIKQNRFLSIESHRGKPGPFNDIYIYKRHGKANLFRKDWLLALTFINEYPTGYDTSRARELEVRHYDGVRGSDEVENLYWAEPGVITLKNKSNVEFEDTFVQSLHYPYVAINRKYQVMNLWTGYLTKSSKNSDGYLKVTLVRNGIFNGHRIHRLIGELFVPPKEGYTMTRCLAELEINHKDGIKTNNHPNNLEWLTHLDNIIHAHQTGLITSKTPCLVRNIFTNEVLTFSSITEAANFLEINLGDIFRILNCKQVGLRRRFDYVFKYDDDTPWPIVNLDEIYDRWAYRSVYTVFHQNGEVENFTDKTSLLLRIKSKDYREIKNVGEVFINNFRILSRLEPLIPSLLIERKLKTANNLKGRSFLITDTSQSKVFECRSFKTAADFLGITKYSFARRAFNKKYFTVDHFVIEDLE